MNRPFWQKPLRVIQTNLRAVDAIGMDVEKLYDQLADCGVNLAIVNAGGLLAWYPTKIPEQHVNPYLTFDYVGRSIEEAHKRGMKVLLRVDISNIHESDLEKYRDCLRLNAKGEIVYDLGMPQSCVYSPIWQEYNFKVLEELLDNYDMDGFFYNAIHYGFCHCDRCRRRFREVTGLELPDVLDEKTETGRTYIEYRYKEMHDFFSRVKLFIQERKPDAILSAANSVVSDAPEFNCYSGWSVPEFTKLLDLPTSEIGSPDLYLLSGDMSLAMTSMGQRGATLLHYSAMGRRSGQPAAQMRYELAQIAAFGASPWLNVLGTFQLDHRAALPAMRETLRFLQKNERYYEGYRIRAQAALIYSQNTMNYDGIPSHDFPTSMAEFYSKPRKQNNSMAEYRGVFESLVADRISFDTLLEGNLTKEKLAQYPLVILPGISCMSDETAKLLDEYVANGGRVIATSTAASKNEYGNDREKLAMAALPYAVKHTPGGGYLAATDKERLASLKDIDLVACDGEWMVLDPLPGADVVYRDLQRCPAPKVSKPEFSDTAAPVEEYGLYAAKYGKGTTVMLPFGVGRIYHTRRLTDECLLLRDLFKWLLPERNILSDAPYSVTIVDALGDEGEVVHLLNATGLRNKSLQEEIPLYNLSISIRTDAASAVSLTTGETLEAERDGAYLKVRIPVLHSYEVLALK